MRAPATNFAERAPPQRTPPFGVRQLQRCLLGDGHSGNRRESTAPPRAATASKADVSCLAGPTLALRADQPDGRSHRAPRVGRCCRPEKSPCGQVVKCDGHTHHRNPPTISCSKKFSPFSWPRAFHCVHGPGATAWKIYTPWGQCAHRREPYSVSRAVGSPSLFPCSGKCKAP